MVNCNTDRRGRRHRRVARARLEGADVATVDTAYLRATLQKHGAAII